MNASILTIIELVLASSKFVVVTKKEHHASFDGIAAVLRDMTTVGDLCQPVAFANITEMKAIHDTIVDGRPEHLIDITKVLTLGILHLRLECYDVENDVVACPAKPKHGHDQTSESGVVSVIDRCHVSVLLCRLDWLQAFQVRSLM